MGGALRAPSGNSLAVMGEDVSPRARSTSRRRTMAAVAGEIFERDVHRHQERARHSPPWRPRVLLEGHPVSQDLVGHELRQLRGGARTPARSGLAGLSRRGVAPGASGIRSPRLFTGVETDGPTRPLAPWNRRASTRSSPGRPRPRPRPTRPRTSRRRWLGRAAGCVLSKPVRAPPRGIRDRTGGEGGSPAGSTAEGLPEEVSGALAVEPRDPRPRREHRRDPRTTASTSRCSASRC
jgi:hypothetical protein